MKITISPKPIIIAELDIKNFEIDFKNGFELNKSVMKNLKIVNYDKNLVSDIDKAKNFVYMGTDWGNLFMLYNLGVPDYIQFNVYSCNIDGFVSYRPYIKDTTTNTVETKDEIINLKEVIVTNSFNPKLDKHIEYTLAQYIIDYINFDWKTIINYES